MTPTAAIEAAVVAGAGQDEHGFAHHAEAGEQGQRPPAARPLEAVDRPVEIAQRLWLGGVAVGAQRETNGEEQAEDGHHMGPNTWNRRAVNQRTVPRPKKIVVTILIDGLIGRKPSIQYARPHVHRGEESRQQLLLVARCQIATNGIRTQAGSGGKGMMPYPVGSPFGSRIGITSWYCGIGMAVLPSSQACAWSTKCR